MDRAQWNKLADEFETGVCDITREETHNQLTRYVNMVPLSPRKSTLVDLGCGIGSFVLKYGERFRAVIGVEFAPRIIARAKERCAGVEHVEWLTMDIPRAAAQIGAVADLTVCFNVITSPSVAKRNLIWASVAGVTKPKGHALLVLPSLESDAMVEQMLPLRERRAKQAANGLLDRDGALQKHFARSELAPTFAEHGFAAPRIGRIYYPWAKEGMRKPRTSGTKRPWDWICLARRVA
jgi:SAM-dependent methyltransferase